jgi:hypothetical protein
MTPGQLTALGAALWRWCTRSAGHTGIYRYLDNQALTTAEADIIRTAWAYAGKPPQGPSNYRLTQSAPAGGSVPPVTNLRVRQATTTGLNIGWNPVEGATYKWEVVGGDGKRFASGATSGTSFIAQGLPRGKPFAVRVTAVRNGVTSPTTSIVARTKP